MTEPALSDQAAGLMKVGSNQYLSVLAHELQHAVHWNGDRTEDTWVNEGLSEVARAAGLSARGQRVQRDACLLQGLPDLFSTIEVKLKSGDEVVLKELKQSMQSRNA